MRARPIAQIVRVRVELLGRNPGLGPVEVPRPVGAGCHAVAAADAPVVIDDDDAIRLLPGRRGRAGFHALRVLALLTGDRKIGLPFGGHLLVDVEGIAVLEIDSTDHVLALELENADPLDLGVTRLVVLRDTAVDAAPATDAAADIQAVAEEHAVVGSDRIHLHRLAVLL